MDIINLVKTSKETELTDDKVVARVLAGEEPLYELLMRRHNQKLFRVIRSYLTQEQEVEDAMQDTYLKAYEKLHQFRNDAQFSTWLIRIGINIALEKLRVRKRFLPTSLFIEQTKDFSELISQINYLNPEQITIRQEVKQLLEKAIDSIPEKYRIVYTLREIEDMSVQEVALCLELSESNVKIRLLRAKNMLKEYLFKLSENQDIFEFGSYRCDTMVELVMKAVLTEK